MVEQQAARVWEAAKLVDYQIDGIVSRAVLKQPGGSVTAFAFDAGQELKEHTTPFEALLQVLEGEVKVEIAGKPLHLRGGEMIPLPAGVPHAVQAPERCKLLLTMLRGGEG